MFQNSITYIFDTLAIRRRPLWRFGARHSANLAPAILEVWCLLLQRFGAHHFGDLEPVFEYRFHITCNRVLILNSIFRKWNRIKISISFTKMELYSNVIDSFFENGIVLKYNQFHLRKWNCTKM